MESFDIIMIMVAVLQFIATALIGWVMVRLNNLNREVGELASDLKNIIKQTQRESEITDQRFDEKKDKK